LVCLTITRKLKRCTADKTLEDIQVLFPVDIQVLFPVHRFSCLGEAETEALENERHIAHTPH